MTRQVAYSTLALILISHICSPSLFGQTITAEVPIGGGFIAIAATNGDVRTAGLDFQSASGGLIPVAGGRDASPFTFFLSNTPNQVTYGNLGSNVEFANGSCTSLSVGAEAGTRDIQWFWGSAFPVAQPIEFKETTCAQTVPEPTTLQLIGIGLIALFLGRQRKRIRR